MIKTKFANFLNADLVYRDPLCVLQVARDDRGESARTSTKRSGRPFAAPWNAARSGEAEVTARRRSEATAFFHVARGKITYLPENRMVVEFWRKDKQARQAGAASLDTHVTLSGGHVIDDRWTVAPPWVCVTSLRLHGGETTRDGRHQANSWLLFGNGPGDHYALIMLKLGLCRSEIASDCSSNSSCFTAVV